MITAKNEQFVVDGMSTVKNGTLTSEGFIEHKKHPELDFYMPVRLKISENIAEQNIGSLQKPKKSKGVLVYALPGGGSFK